MDIQHIKNHFRSRENVYCSWADVLVALNNCNPNDGNFYMLSVNKGSDSERRTRFYTHAEAVAVVKKELGK